MSRNNDAKKILATAGLLLIDAMVFQETIARFYSQIRTLSQIRIHNNIKRELEEEWSKILDEVDYEPIFNIALNIIQELPASPAVNEALKELLTLAEDIASSPVLLKHDLFGRIYHQLLLGKLAKYFATYYTSIPAARLLARIIINLPSKINAKYIPPQFNNEPLRVVDFACGSGTLLSAIYKEIMLKHRLDSDSPSTKDMHKALIEKVLWGFDVLQHAAHLASTTLFLHEPSQPVENSRIYALKLGVFGPTKRLGSLDFLKDNKIESEMLLIGTVRGARKISVTKEAAALTEELPLFHICIMNPPFTRSVGGNLLFGGLPSEERKILQKELSNILRDTDISGIGQAGLGAVFVFLADKYLKKEGRIGLVLPKAVLGGVAWRKVRQTLLEKYHIEYIISSYEGPNDWNFSENTSLSEILLVARKLDENEKPGYTIFVNLWRKPRSENESIFIGSHLLEIYNNPKLFDITNSNATCYPLRLRGGVIGEAYAAKISEVDFGYLSFFAQAELNRVISLLRQGIIYLPMKGVVGHIPLAPLSKFIADIGPDRRQIHSTFNVGIGSYKALWGYDSNSMRTIKQVANKRLKPKEGKVQAARNIWKKSSRFLVTERAWLSTYRVLAVMVDDKVLSNVWWPIITDDETGKILSLWFNSTYGMLLLLSIAEITRGPWISFKKDMLKDLPVIDLSKLDSVDKNNLLDLYDKIKMKQFKPIPEEFKSPSTRKILDDTINRILNIGIGLEELYQLLAKDPMITGNSLIY